MLRGKINGNHLAYRICAGICYLSVDCGGTWGVKIGAKSSVDVATLPDEALPALSNATAACYPKDPNANNVFGVSVSRSTKKLTARNNSSTTTSYWSVDFCYPV